MTKSLILVRHGQIAANKNRQWHGSTDSDLTTLGQKQAAGVGKFLTNFNILSVYSSPLRRCVETARPIAAPHSHVIQVVPDLAEYAIGEWEGMAFARLANDFDFPRVLKRDPDFQPPGGESLRQVRDRVMAAVFAINMNDLSPGDSVSDAPERQNGAVVVVAHGVVFGIMLASLLDGDCTKWTNYMVENCSYTHLVIDEDPFVEAYNQVVY